MVTFLVPGAWPLPLYGILPDLAECLRVSHTGRGLVGPSSPMAGPRRSRTGPRTSRQEPGQGLGWIPSMP